MIKYHRRAFFFVLLSFLFGYIFFFVDTLRGYPGENLLYFYKVPWVFEEALRSLIEHFPTLSITGVLIAFSTTRAPEEILSNGAAGISTATRKTILVLLFFTFLFTVLQIGLLPGLYAHRHNRLYSSSLARSYFERAQLLEKSGSLSQAYELYQDYLQIDSENEEIKAVADRLAGSISIQESQALPAPQKRESSLRTEYRQMDIPELLRRSEEALKQEDPFTAHFLAGLILDMDENREDAQRLAAQAWEQIGSLEPNSEQRQERLYYRQKVAAYETLQKDRPLEAYYRFKELLSRSPQDRDVKKYYQESLRQAEELSYFIQDAQMTRTKPGINKIVFLERRDEDRWSLFFIDKLVEDSGRHWAHGVEILGFSEERGELFHLTAPYAKVYNRQLLLRGIDRDKENTLIEPRYLTDREPPEIPHIIGIKPDVVEMSRLSRDLNFLHRLNLPALLSIRPKVEEFGHQIAGFDQLILDRLTQPFLFLILSLLSIGMGRHLCYRGRKFPLHLVWIIPLLPLVVKQMVLLYQYAHRLILSPVVIHFGFVPGLVALLILQAVLMFIALFSISLHKEL